MNDTGVTRESEFVLRRLADAFPVGPPEAAAPLWLAATGLVLLAGVAFVARCYARDTRSIRWYFAAPLAAARAAVYVLLAGAFLLPAVQTWEKAEKRSKVVVVLDVSPSVAEVSDDLGSAARPRTRLDKVLDFLTDDKAGFLPAVLQKNPVTVYRFGSRLDDEPLAVAADGPARTKADWDKWARYDFKAWVADKLSPAGRDLVERSPGWKGAAAGTPEWAIGYAKLADAEAVPAGLSEADAAALRDARAKLEGRVDVARAVAQGTDVPGSLTAVVNREAGNMVQGLVVFTDGRSNLGSEAAYAELRERAGREKVPVFTVAVGDARELVGITVADVQAPDRAPPDEPFKVAVEADGVGLERQEVDVRLGLYLPGRDPKKAAPDHELTQKLTFQPGDPPHGQAEFVVDPDKLPEALTEPSKKVGRVRQLRAGAWAFVARIARDKREAFPDPDHVSPPRAVQVIDKPLRVLLFAGGPTREYQTLRTMLAREVQENRAELSICLQTQGGRDGTAVQDVPPERLLPAFPTRLDVGGRGADKPEDKYSNLNEYDLVIAFDPDWSQVPADHLKALQAWVDNLGGGLIYVAGPIHTYQLARGAEDGGKLKPLLDLLPVQPDDLILIKTRPVPRAPRRLALNPSPDADVLKLDEDRPDDPVAGWEGFFTGNLTFAPSADPRADASPARGFYAYYPVKETKPLATVLAEFRDVLDSGQVDARPWLVTAQPSRGRTAFLASGEVWRLRAYDPDYYQRFWVKLARHVAANRDARAARGRVLLGKQFVAGGPVRVQARLLDPKGEPYREGAVSPTFKVVTYSAAGDPLGKVAGPFELKPKKGGGPFDGYYTGQVAADPRLFPPGDNRYRVVVDVPDSAGDALTGEFTVKKADPERDNPRPDFAALYQAASPVADVAPRIADPAVADKLAGPGSGAADARLAFRLADADRLALIPACFEAKRQEFRNRGPVDDIWDDGPTVTVGGKPAQVAWVLLACAGLLSAEWASRKLLRLA